MCSISSVKNVQILKWLILSHSPMRCGNAVDTKDAVDTSFPPGRSPLFSPAKPGSQISLGFIHTVNSPFVSTSETMILNNVAEKSFSPPKHLFFN